MKIRLWLILLLIFSITVFAQDLLKIYCIDVDQGDATLIVSPTNQYILIDAGDISGNYGDSVYRFIKNLGITHLKHTIATHYHADHIGGFPVVICSLSGGANRNDSVLGWCYDRGDSNPTLTQPYNSYVTVCTLNNKRRIIGLGETLDLGGGAMMICVARNGQVVNGTGVTPNEENDRCLAFILKYGHFKFFIGGDLSGSNQAGYRDVESWVAPVVGKIDVLRVNHHGSKYSSNRTFLDSLKPRVAIISVGNNPYGYPFQEVIDSLVSRNSFIYQLNENPSGGGSIPTNCGRILNTNAEIIVNNIDFIVNGDTYPIRGVRRDASVLEIISPKDTITEGIEIRPRVKIKNCGNITDYFMVRFQIGSVYNKTKTISALASQDTITISFDTTWIAQSGNYQIICSTEVSRDSNPTNNKQTTNLTVLPAISGWHNMKTIPKPIQDGGALTSSSNQIYAFTGNSRAFLVYEPTNNYWQVKESIPFGYNLGKLKTKVVKRGGALTSGKDNLGFEVIYGLKGNNTYEVWKYIIHQNNWQQINQFYKPYKGGSAIVYYQKGSQKLLFSLWGNTKENDFQAYNITTGQWLIKDTAPGKFKDGSAMTVVRDSIFVLKGGAKINEFYCYDIIQDTWLSLAPMPQIHPHIERNKKVKSGGALTYDAITNKIYAFKGGGTQEFWSYDIYTNIWTFQETIPTLPPGDKRSVVKAGGSLTALNGRIFAFKGNKRNEFWQYIPTYQKIANIYNNSNKIPTPQSNKLNNNSILTLKEGAIYNINGQKIIQIPESDFINLEYKNLKPGIYFIVSNPTNNNSKGSIRKIIIPR